MTLVDPPFYDRYKVALSPSSLSPEPSGLGAVEALGQRLFRAQL